MKTNPEAGAHGCSFFLVPTKTKGFSVSKKLKKIGNHASDTAELFFEDMRVPQRYLLGEPNQGFMYLMQNFQTERLIACVERVRRPPARDRRHDRVRPRAQGVRQADHQARVLAAQVRRPLRRSSRRPRRSRYKAAEMYNDERYVKKEPLSFETVKIITMAKIFVGELGTEVIDQCLQFHGGSGYIEEYPHRARLARPAPAPHRRRHDRDDAVLRREADGALTVTAVVQRSARA